MPAHNSTPAPALPAYVYDIRELPFNERQTLITDPTVKLYDGDVFVMEIPRKLFLITTTLPELLPDSSDEIHLPPNTGNDAILSIGCYLLATTSQPKVFNLRSRKDVEADLRLCKAGRLLGMEGYILHIHNYYWWLLSNAPFTVSHVRIIATVALDLDDPFLRLVCEIMATHIREGTLPSGELKTYVDSNPMLQNQIARKEKEHQTRVKIQEDKAARAERREMRLKIEAEQREAERARHAAVQAEREAERQRFDEERREKMEKSKARWADKRKKEAELNKALQEKARLGKNAAIVTREEARYYERTKGKRCPYKICG